MADLSTFSAVDSELAATADYDVGGDLDKARRRVAALRRKLDFPQAAAGDSHTMAFYVQAIENQLSQVLAWIGANETPTEAERLANPSVIHADFSTFGKYAGGCP